MGVGQGLGDLDADLEAPVLPGLAGGGQAGVVAGAAGAQDVGQRAALHQLHGEEGRGAGVADGVDRHDVGVAQAAGGLGLALEAGQALLVVAHVEGHHAHAAPADLALDLEVAQPAGRVTGGPSAAPRAAGRRLDQVEQLEEAREGVGVGRVVLQHAAAVDAFAGVQAVEDGVLDLLQGRVGGQLGEAGGAHGRSRRRFREGVGARIPGPTLLMALRPAGVARFLPRSSGRGVMRRRSRRSAHRGPSSRSPSSPSPRATRAFTADSLHPRRAAVSATVRPSR